MKKIKRIATNSYIPLLAQMGEHLYACARAGNFISQSQRTAFMATVL